jgi:hypothetical protein
MLDWGRAGLFGRSARATFAQQIPVLFDPADPANHFPVTGLAFVEIPRQDLVEEARSPQAGYVAQYERGMAVARPFLLLLDVVLLLAPFATVVANVVAALYFLPSRVW